MQNYHTASDLPPAYRVVPGSDGRFYPMRFGCWRRDAGYNRISFDTEAKAAAYCRDEQRDYEAHYPAPSDKSHTTCTPAGQEVTIYEDPSHEMRARIPLQGEDVLSGWDFAAMSVQHARELRDALDAALARYDTQSQLEAHMRDEGLIAERPACGNCHGRTYVTVRECGELVDTMCLDCGGTGLAV